MWLELFLCLFLAHLVSDFVLQTSRTCEDKCRNKWHSPYQYIHAFIVFGTSWLAIFDLRFGWCAFLIGISHLFIDVWKSFHDEKVEWFIIDQILHILVILGVSILWCASHEWSVPLGISPRLLSGAVAALVCWKPANIFIKLVLKHYSVNMPVEKESGFNAGALIGTIERWLVLIFVCLQRYDALGLLIAAKSIIRFREKDAGKSEYVLAGTLLSILIAVISGLSVMYLVD